MLRLQPQMHRSKAAAATHASQQMHTCSRTWTAHMAGRPMPVALSARRSAAAPRLRQAVRLHTHAAALAAAPKQPPTPSSSSHSSSSAPDSRRPEAPPLRSSKLSSAELAALAAMQVAPIQAAARAARRAAAASAAAGWTTNHSDASSAGQPARPLPHGSLVASDADTTVLLVGWLGCKPSQLQKYQNLHESCGRRVISYRPSIWSWLNPLRFESSPLHQSLHQLEEDAALGKGIVIHAFSNMGAFHVALLLQELHQPGGDRAERMKHTLCNAIRGVVFDSAPAPLSVELITRGYVAFVAGLRPPFWRTLKRMISRRSGKGKGREQDASSPPPRTKGKLVPYSSPLLSPLVRSVVQLLLRASPNFRRHLANLHVSLRTLLPASTHLLYLYSPSDLLIPPRDILAHAESQAHLPPQRALVACKTILEPREQAEFDRAQLEFEQRIYLMQPKQQERERAARAIELARKGKREYEPLPVDSVRMYAAQQPPQSDSAEHLDLPSTSPLEDDPAPLLAQLRSQLSSLLSAIAGSKRLGSLDIVRAPLPAARIHAVAESGTTLLRTITSVRFHASPHVQHGKVYPQCYKAVMDHWIAHWATPQLYQIPRERRAEVEKVAEALAAQGQEMEGAEHARSEQEAVARTVQP